VYIFRFPIQAGIRLSAAAAITAAMAYSIDRAIPGLLGLVLAITTAIPVYLILVKLIRGLQFSIVSAWRPLKPFPGAGTQALPRSY
jgi:hypothetical protein